MSGLPCLQYKQEAEYMSRAAAQPPYILPLICRPFSAILGSDPQRRSPSERRSHSSPGACQSTSS